MFKYLGNTGKQCISTFVQKNCLENVLEFLFSKLHYQIFKILDGPKNVSFISMPGNCNKVVFRTFGKCTDIHTENLLCAWFNGRMLSNLKCLYYLECFLPHVCLPILNIPYPSSITAYDTRLCHEMCFR